MDSPVCRHGPVGRTPVVRLMCTIRFLTYAGDELCRSCYPLRDLRARLEERIYVDQESLAMVAGILYLMLRVVEHPGRGGGSNAGLRCRSGRNHWLIHAEIEPAAGGGLLRSSMWRGGNRVVTAD